MIGPRARAHWLVFPAALCALALGCVPRPGGECASDADCEGTLTCQDGLCRMPPPRACVPGCGAGFHCDDGTCALDQAPSVTWIAPDADALRATGQLALTLAVRTPARDLLVRVQARPLDGAALARSVSVTLVQESDGLFRALLDVSALEERDWALVPVVTAARRDWPGTARGLRIDRTGPSIDLVFPRPAGQSFLRSDTIEVRARLRDPGAGVDPASVRLVAPGMADVQGTRLNQTDWSFQAPLAAPTFLSAEGPLSLGVRAQDTLGNVRAAMGSVPVTRTLWRRALGDGAAIRSSVALDDKRVFLGTSSGQLVSLDRASGTVVWSHHFVGAVSASPVRGERAVYAVSEGGMAEAFDPGSGALLWSCPNLPEGVQFFSSPALHKVPGTGADTADLETLFVTGTGGVLDDGTPLRGGLYAIQGTRGFAYANGGSACWMNVELGGGRSSPAIDLTGAIYVGGEDARAHKLRFLPDAAGTFTFREEWSLPASDDVLASPAIADGGIFFGDVDGQLAWVSPAGDPRLTGPLLLGEKLLSSPVIAFGTALVQGREGTLKPFTRTGLPAREPSPSFAPQKIPGVSGVESTPAVGDDGTIYLAAGRSLRALSPAGSLLWEAPLAGASTASSPNLSCDGVVYLADASGTVSAFLTDSRGLAPGWPRFRHDSRGTGNEATIGCE